MRMITVDPGLCCGIVCWIHGNPWRTTTITHSRKCKGFFAKADDMIFRLQEYLRAPANFFSADEIHLEWPAVYPSPGGQTAARSGSIVKLAYITGRIAETFKSVSSNLLYIDVRKWKGQVPKTIMNRRVQRVLEAEGIRSDIGKNSHELDALGIGLWVLGKLDNNG